MISVPQILFQSKEDDHHRFNPTSPGSHPKAHRSSLFSSPNECIELHEHSHHDETHHVQKELTLREKIFLTMEDPSFSKMALFVFGGMFVLVIMSAVLLCVASYPQYHNHSPTSIRAIDLLLNSIFTIEYLLRLATAPVPWLWALKAVSIIDLLALFPSYIEAAVQGGVSGLAIIRIIRIFRILRLFRIARLAHKNPAFLILYTSATRSKAAVVASFTMMGTAVVVFSCAMFYAEQIYSTYHEEDAIWVRPDGEPSPYQSIVHTFWWCIVSLTATGYGDTYPITWPGKIIGGITMTAGLLTLAFPISLIGAEFARVWQQYQQKEMIDQRELLKEKKKKIQQKHSQKDTLLMMHHTCQKMEQDVKDMRRRQDKLLSLVYELEQQQIAAKTAVPEEGGRKSTSLERMKYSLERVRSTIKKKNSAKDIAGLEVREEKRSAKESVELPVVEGEEISIQPRISADYPQRDNVTPRES